MFNQTLADQAAKSADMAIQATQRAASDALDTVAHTVQRGVDTVRDNAQRASTSTVNYIQHDPVKSVLIAAATGAALMALISLLNRPHSRA